MGRVVDIMNDYEIYQVDFDYFEKLIGINDKSKLRPALVVISKALQVPLMYPITSTRRNKHYEIRDWKEAGLSKPSYLVYDFSREISPREYLIYVGRLSDYDIQRIKSERLLKEETMRKFNQLKEGLKISLNESWKTNGSLESFNPQDLVNKAIIQKYSINSVREFGDKFLYINVDPGFMFGSRREGDKIWINIVEIDVDTDNQDRILLEPARDEDEAVEILNTWKQEYIEEHK